MRFAKDDLVIITFSGQQDLQPHEERIKEDGTITLQYIGSIKAEGKTTGELQREIHDAYVPTYYKRLTPTVKTDRQIYYVQGQVRQSGRQEYLGPTTVLKAIASAGDFTDFASRKRVRLNRKDGSWQIIDCKKAAENPALDLPVFPGDKIDVPVRNAFETW
jgi:polysaccharide export outer membrane protein